MYINLQAKVKIVLRGHFSTLHVSSNVSFPEQNPPNISFTVLVRVFIRMPPPHVVEHAPVLQSPHLQSTIERDIQNIISCGAGGGDNTGEHTGARPHHHR